MEDITKAIKEKGMYSLRPPHYDHYIGKTTYRGEDFHLLNYQFNLGRVHAREIQKALLNMARTDGPTHLHNILAFFGRGAELQIGSLSGILGISANEPHDSKYPNGQPVHKELFWNWYLDEPSREVLLETVNSKHLICDLLDARADFPIKTLQLIKIIESFGELKSINYIPILRLCGIVNSGDYAPSWIFTKSKEEDR